MTQRQIGNQTVQVFASPETRDNLGRLLTSRHQNIFDADFEYSPQPLRWEALNTAGSSITHLPGTGGVRLRLGAAAGQYTIRQSRPYHRYQPGKTMFMASAVTFGQALAGQRQRVGFFDDSNGVFFEQGDPTAENPYGMGVVIRSDADGVLVDNRIELNNWSGSASNGAPAVNWNAIQMMWIEFAWYGAGLVRWGVFLEGIKVTLHEYARSNQSGITTAWSRTGNLPVRYEQRNLTAQAGTSDMLHYGVSVIVEGGIDEQRGFTYAYGLPQSASRRSVAGSASRFPLMSFRARTMGTQEFGNTTGVTTFTGPITAVSATTLTVTGTPLTAGALVNRFVAYGAGGATPTVARITANTTSTITLSDPLTGGTPATAPVVGNQYTIGIVNRGQLLPRRLQLTSDQPVYVEVFVSTPTSPVTLTGASFVANPAAVNSFALIDSSASAYTTSGECVYSLFVPANNPVDQQIDNLFPLVNVVRGGAPDILSVVVTNVTASAALVSCQIIAQEAMS